VNLAPGNPLRSAVQPSRRGGQARHHVNEWFENRLPVSKDRGSRRVFDAQHHREGQRLGFTWCTTARARRSKRPTLLNSTSPSTASYVIVRGITLKGAAADRDSASRRNVPRRRVIEDNDISGWGRIATARGAGHGLRRSRKCQERRAHARHIQRNRIHDPRYSANSWTNGHSGRPPGLDLQATGGGKPRDPPQQIYGGRSTSTRGGEDEDNLLEDGLFPNADFGPSTATASRAPGMTASRAEGGNKKCASGATSSTSGHRGHRDERGLVGPVYIFRNV